MYVGTFAVLIDCLAHCSLQYEACFFIGPFGARVGGIDAQINAIEIQSLEPVLQNQLHDFGAVPFVPHGFIADHDSEFSRAMRPLDVEETTVADQTPIFMVSYFDGQRLLGLFTPAGAFQPALLVHHRSEEHTSELQSPTNLVCRLLLEK